MWSRGLTGHGQVVGVGDTGIQEKSCYFDDIVPVPYNNNDTVSQHRKITTYYTRYEL